MGLSPHEPYRVFATAAAEEKAGEPRITALNFSGGRQSSALLWMVLRGDIPKPDNFVVLHADPGMENSRTYDYVRFMFEECRRAGIHAETVEGPNLYHDLTSPEGTRLDNPPYWTLNNEGRRGRLNQKCTRYYKIRPMDKALRKIMEERLDIPFERRRVGYGVAEKWIGFTTSEASRVKPPRQKYQVFRYPLIDLGMTNEDVIQYFRDHDLPIPPRSVCNACFANGLQTLKRMHDERPRDWAQAVEVDRAARDGTRYGITDRVYVSKMCVPLEELAARGFQLTKEDRSDDEDLSCDSGYCFV